MRDTLTRFGDTNLIKTQQSPDCFQIVKPDGMSNTCSNSSTSTEYVQLAFSFLEDGDCEKKSQYTQDNCRINEVPDQLVARISLYTQRKLPLTRPMRENGAILRLIETVENGRPFQKAEARYHLRQILEQNPNHFMREEMGAALGENDSVRIHTIQQDTEKIETQRNFSSQVIMMLKEFAALLNDGNLAIRTVISGFLQKMPEGFENLKSMMKKNGPGFVKDIRSFVGGKTVNKMILAGKLLGGAIIYPVKMGLFLCGTLALATLVVITDKIFNGQISQTGRYASEIPAYA